MTEHNVLPTNKLHPVPGLGPYADAATRITAGAGLTSADIDKFAKQVDTQQYWALTAAGVWRRVNGPKVPVNDASTAYTFVAADVDFYRRFTAATAVAATIPTNASVPFPIGTEIELIQAGAGQVTITAAAGVTFGPGTLYGTSGVGASIRAKKIATDTWDITGSLASGAGTYTHPALAVTTATLVAAYDAAFSTIVTGVSQLTDQGTGGKHLVQATTGKQPAFTGSNSTINNKPSFRSDGTDDELVCSTLAMGDARYLVIVYSPLADGSICGGTTNQAGTIFNTGGNQFAYAGTISSSTSIGYTGVWALDEVYYKNDGTGTRHCTWNNTSGTLTQTGASYGAAADTSWGLASRAGGNFGRNDYANISIFASKPSSGEIATLRAALIARYGLPFS